MNQNIMQLCFSPDLGGLELYVQKISSFLNNKVNLTIIVNEKGKLKKALENEKLNYISFKKPSKVPLITAKKIAEIIDQKQIDLIHIHWTKDIPVAVLAKLFSKRKPKLVQSRHMTMTRFKSDFYHKFLYKNIDLMIAVTKQVQEQIEKFVPTEVRPQIQTLYIGAKSPIIISEEKKLKIQKQYNIDCFTVGIVGRIEKGKGQYLLIDAIKKLKAQSIDMKALIVGHAMTENYKKELQEIVQQHNLQNNIIFTGFTSEVQNLMQVCDVLVLATYKETFGLVLIEAMKCGICVIASNSGGPLEIIENNKSGLFFETKNSDDLSTKLKELYTNPKLKLELALQGQKRANNLFDEQKQFNELLTVLQGI